MSILGAHLSIAGGFARAAGTAVEIGADTFQFFSRNPRGSSVKAFDGKDLEEFRRIREENHFAPLLAHTPYTMNLAGARDEVYEFARMVVRGDIARMDAIGVEYINLHPGSHVGAGTEAGVAKIADALNQAITGEERIVVLLETMSGKGSEIGSSFSELRKILDRVEHRERMGVCLDTCHVFSAGYDIADRLDDVAEEFDRIIGLPYLRAVHLNDSMTPFGAGKDRHAAVGEGEIGLEALLRVMTHPAFRDLPFYLETPLDDQGHREEIKMIREKLLGLSH